MISVFIDYKPLKSEYIIISDEIFVSSQELVERLKKNITWDETSLWISVDGKEIPMKGLMTKGQVFLPLL